MQEKLSRKIWLDVLRAVAILLVIYGHTMQPDTGYFVFTSPIKIPLFFAISGYLFNDRNGNIPAFFNKLLWSLVVPWLLLTLGQGVLFIPIKGFSYYAGYVRSVILGDSFWYMPCCILGEIIFFFILKYGKKQLHIVLASLILTVIGLLLSRIEMFDYFKFSVALIAQSFLLLGYSIRKYEQEIRKIKTGWLAVGLVLYILLGVFTMYAFSGQCLDVNTSEYYNLPICAAMIVLGCFLLFAFAPRIPAFPGAVAALGSNTLVFYLFHSIIHSAIVKVVGTASSAWWIKLLEMIGACIICAFAAFILNRILPAATGRSAGRKQGSISIKKWYKNE